MSRFDLFVILAGMRTGSNLLEERLNRVPGLISYGEVFNPHFVGHPKSTQLFGIGLAERDRDPVALAKKLASETEGLGGFRLFQDHDERVLKWALAEPRCAKIVLTRNPVESYVSLKIARATGQWWLGDARSARRAKAHFDKAEFTGFLDARRDFYLRVNRALQTTGQAGFHLDYADLGDSAVTAGLTRYLGASGPPDSGSTLAKVQNPEPLSEKVDNYDEMVAALAGADYFDLGRIPSFEPARGPGIPSFMVSEKSGLLFMPMRGGPTGRVRSWLEREEAGPVATGFTRRDLRRWKRTHPGHLSFTVVSHPVERAHEVFCRRILATGQDSYPEIRAALRANYGLPIPESAPGSDWSADAHGRAFLAFLSFLKVNVGGQTAIRIDPDWTSQANLLHALASVMVPDRVFRAHRLDAELGRLIQQPAPPRAGGDGDSSAPRLEDVYGREIEAAARATYPRDYMMFGFGAWSPPD